MVDLRYRRMFEEEKCDPKKYHIAYCVDYFNNKDCPQTCNYARNKKALESTLKKDLAKLGEL